VKTGIYNETVMITKNVSLVGENREMTLIDKGIIIEADGVIVNGFTISSKYGVWVKSSKCLITNNSLVACHLEGIFLDGRNEGVSENVVTNNYILNNSDCGVLVWGGSHNYIGFNTVTNNYVGVYLYNTSMNLIKRNDIISNLDTGVVIDWFSFYNLVIKNNISDNGWRGWPQLGMCGIDFLHSDFNQIISNDILNNKYAIELIDADKNFIYHNNFINNTNQLSSDLRLRPPYTNVWDGGYPSGGNYWSDYNNNDTYSGPYQNETGSDGIGDTQYNIDANNRDRYPLIQPYIWLIGDLNDDDTVDMKDLRIVAKAFASFPSDPRWNPEADINKDGKVDMVDIRLTAKRFGHHLTRKS